MVEVGEIRQFCFTQEFKTEKGVSAYAGHIYARSFEEAEKMCQSFGAKLDGELIETQCANCGKIEIVEREDWDDEII